MQSRLSVIYAFVLYSFTAIIFRGVAFILHPFYMRLFAPAQFGALGLIESFVYICTTITGVGLRKLFMIEYAHYDHDQQKKLTNTIIVIYLLLVLPLLLFLIVMRVSCVTFFFKNTITLYTFYCVLIITFCSFFCELLYQIMRFESYAYHLSFIHLLHTFFILCFTLSGLLYLNLGFIALPMAQGLTMIIIVLIGMYVWLRGEYYQFISLYDARKEAISIIKRSTPLTVNVLLLWSLESGDRWFLSLWSTMDQVGLYSAAYIFNGLMYALIVMPWSGAYLPFILKQYATQRTNIKSVEVIHQRVMWCSMMVLFVLLIIGIYISTYFLNIFFPPSYHCCLPLIFPLMLARIIYFGVQWQLCLPFFVKKLLY